jgi:hypothetical protein
VQRFTTINATLQVLTQCELQVTSALPDVTFTYTAPLPAAILSVSKPDRQATFLRFWQTAVDKITSVATSTKTVMSKSSVNGKFQLSTSTWLSRGSSGYAELRFELIIPRATFVYQVSLQVHDKIRHIPRPHVTDIISKTSMYH